jgi:predicted enzyme related to lactoylglutathione lyase
MSKSDGSTADYYVLPDGATQLQDLISHRDMNSQIGEIFRACYRYGIVSHSDKMRDAKKIRFYAQAEVERLEKLGAASEQCGQLEAQEAEKAAHIISDIPDMQEWQNWKGGDVVESMEATQGIENGGFYILIADPDEDGDIRFIDSEGDNRARDADKYRFASRPTSTAK